MPISIIPKICPIPQYNPIFQAFLFDSIAKGITAAIWSGPMITCSIEAKSPATNGKDNNSSKRIKI